MNNKYEYVVNTYIEQIALLSKKEKLADFFAPEINALPNFQIFLSSFFETSELKTFDRAEEYFAGTLNEMKKLNINRLSENCKIMSSMLRYIKQPNDKEISISAKKSNTTYPSENNLSKEQFELLSSTELTISPSGFNIKIKEDSTRTLFIVAKEDCVSFKQVKVQANPELYCLPRIIDDTFEVKNSQILYTHTDSDEYSNSCSDEHEFYKN